MSLKLKFMTTVAALALATPLVAQTEGETADCSLAENATLQVCMDAAAEGTEAEGTLGVETDMAEDETAPMETEMDSDTDMATETDADTMMEAETDTDMADTEADTTMGTDDTAATGMSPMDDGIAEFEGMTVAGILGMNVVGANGNDVGEIDYIIQTGGVYEAVIGIGGFLGLGEYTVALPLSAFSIAADNEAMLVLDGYTEEELEAMPEIDESTLQGLDSDHVIG